MIAIPVDSATPGVKSSMLFGNVPMFAIYSPEEEQFFIIRNAASGNGIETAKFLKSHGVEEVVYSYMGDGPFSELDKDGVDIYYLGKEPVALFKIVEELDKGNYVKVDKSNAQTYLDPGTASENCECGCSHG